MKKFYVVLLMLVFVAKVQAQVTLPHLDPINYTVGQGLQTQTGWTLLNSGDDIAIASGNLSYAGLSASSGNKITFDAAGIDAAKSFTQQTTGTVYYSFIMNVTALGSLNATGGYFTGFTESANNNFGASVWTRSDGVGYDIGVNPRTTAANTVWTSGTTSINNTVFVVISYQIVSGTSNDVVKLWVNPTPGAVEPAATLTATNTGGTDLLNLNRILIRQDGTAATPFIQMDEFRIGTNWADVTPAGGTADVSIAAGGIANGNVGQGVTNAVLQRYDLGVTSFDANLNGLTVTTAGTYTASDIVNLKVRYSVDATLDGGDATLSTKTTGLGAGSQVFPSFTQQTITAGTTGYIFVTADISPTGVIGNTINIDPTTFANISFAGTVNKTGTDPVPAGGTKTIAALAPSIAITGASPTDGFIYQNSNDNILYGVQFNVTVNNATLNSFTVSTTGTYQVSDLQANTFKLWINNTSSLSGATLLSTQAIVASGNNIVFNGLTASMPAGETRYLFVTTSVSSTGTPGNTIRIAATPFSNIVFASGTLTGTDPVDMGGTQTINIATPSIVLTNLTTAAATVANGTSNVILYQFSASVGSNTTNFTGASFTTAGTYTAGDLVSNSFKLWYNTVNNFSTASTIATSAVVASGGSVSFSFSQALPVGPIEYFWVTTDVVAAPVSGHTVNITSTPLSNFTFSSGVVSGPADPMNAGGVKTIALVPLAGEVVINQFNPGYGGASDEYIELVNKTGKSFDLSALRISYQSSAGTSGGAGGVLSGTLLPYSYWLLSPNGVVTVGTTSLTRDGAITAGFAAAAGQLALVVVSSGTVIDALGYGTLTGGTFSEGTAAASPSSNAGLKRNEGDDTNNNSTDFSSVAVASIDLRDKDSRLAQPGSTIDGAGYVRLNIKGDAVLNGDATISDKVEFFTGKLTLNNSVLHAATFVGASGSSYVITNSSGLVSINNVGTTTVLFPVGPSASLYHPVTISNSGTPDEINVRVSSTSSPCTPATTSVNATWDIFEGTPGGSNLTLSLDYTGATTGATYNAAQAQIVHCNGPSSDYHNGTVTGTVATGTGFTTFSPFSISNDVSILPVTLTSIKATQQGNGVKVEWTNMTESALTDYNVERSTDGILFTSIQAVSPSLNNGSRADYNYLDANAPAGTIYYRIRANNNDGSKKYSSIARVNTKGDKPTITVYPNPVTDHAVSFQATALPKGQYTLRIINGNGQQIMSQPIQHNGGSITQSVTLPNGVTTGIYTLQLTGGDVRLVEKLVVR